MALRLSLLTSGVDGCWWSCFDFVCVVREDMMDIGEFLGGGGY